MTVRRALVTLGYIAVLLFSGMFFVIGLAGFVFELIIDWAFFAWVPFDQYSLEIALKQSGLWTSLAMFLIGAASFIFTRRNFSNWKVRQFPSADVSPSQRE